MVSRSEILAVAIAETGQMAGYQRNVYLLEDETGVEIGGCNVGMNVNQKLQMAHRRNAP